jgi:hypothetical protein
MVVEPAVAPFAAWESFYVIVGSSAGALTGLQFVVVALSADARALRSEGSILAFGTPTIVHFCAVLLAAAILSAPWESLSGAAIALTLCAAAGIAYTVVVILRVRRPGPYAAVFEDWLWHVVLPAFAYLSQLVAAFCLPDHPAGALFALAGVAVLLMFCGIHNAWDAAAYIALHGRGDDGAAGAAGKP